MFVAVYRWRLRPELEQDFVAHWRRITELGLGAGSGGSSLFKDADGCWVAMARWPSRDTRARFFAQLADDAVDPALGERARQAIVERFPDQELESVLDLWCSLPGAVA